MSARGLGTDIVEIVRIQNALDRHGQDFLDRLFTKQEQEYCFRFQKPMPHFAARFAAKEAAVKALGIGFGKNASWHDIEITNDPLGKPSISLSTNLKKLFQNPELLVSLSHTDIYATAVVIWT
jgi:holo-[acyl-carrier protein] synthase